MQWHLYLEDLHYTGTSTSSMTHGQRKQGPEGSVPGNVGIDAGKQERRSACTEQIGARQECGPDSCSFHSPAHADRTFPRFKIAGTVTRIVSVWCVL